MKGQKDASLHGVLTHDRLFGEDCLSSAGRFNPQLFSVAVDLKSPGLLQRWEGEVVGQREIRQTLIKHSSVNMSWKASKKRFSFYKSRNPDDSGLLFAGKVLGKIFFFFFEMGWCLCIYASLSLSLCLCTCGGQRLTFGVFLNHSPPYYLKQSNLEAHQLS